MLGLKAELDEMIKMINDSIADIQPSSSRSTTVASAAAASSKGTPVAAAPAPSPPAPEKWSRENHPAFKKQAQEEKERAEAAAREAELAAAPINYQVNDTVLAKWVSGDKGFYTARITAVTGSSTQPIYTVKFKSYDTVETLRAKDIRPVSNKRKADGSTGASSTSAGGTATASPTTTSPSTPVSGSAAVFPSVGGGGGGAGGGSSTAINNGTVLTAAPSVYPQAEQQTADGEKPAKKFKKIKATKELEKGKNKWQEFNNKSKFGKTHKKDSMFRTPEGVHGRGMFCHHGLWKLSFFVGSSWELNIR